MHGMLTWVVRACIYRGMADRSRAAEMLAAWATETGQAAVAQVLGKSQSTISRWIAEQGAPPDYETRRRAWVARRIPLGAWWERRARAGGTRVGVSS